MTSSQRAVSWSRIWTKGLSQPFHVFRSSGRPARPMIVSTEPTTVPAIRMVRAIAPDCRMKFIRQSFEAGWRELVVEIDGWPNAARCGHVLARLAYAQLAVTSAADLQTQLRPIVLPGLDRRGQIRYDEVVGTMQVLVQNAGRGPALYLRTRRPASGSCECVLRAMREMLETPYVGRLAATLSRFFTDCPDRLARW
jgi:hypothetical protein